MDDNTLILLVAIVGANVPIYLALSNIGSLKESIRSLRKDVTRIDNKQKAVINCLIKEGCDIQLPED